MNWKLDFEIKSPSSLISIRQPVFLTGSCFAEHIGAAFLQHKFRAFINPNGILFNPLSICKSLEDCLHTKPINENSLLFHNELWYSWEHHGSFSHTDKEQLKEQLLSARQTAAVALEQAEWVIITLGSAWVYELKNTGELVANCHKVPQSQFSKRLLHSSEIISSFDQLFRSEQMKKKNILLTVSPVRYVRDGLVENNVSKAQLIQAVYHLCNEYRNVHYFPAYEIVIDELRDYRFFEEDLVHPNQLAIDYVWERFSSHFFDDETHTVLKELAPVLSAASHRPIQPDTQQHRDFKRLYFQKAIEVEQRYPFINLEAEKLLLQ